MSLDFIEALEGRRLFSVLLWTPVVPSAPLPSIRAMKVVYPNVVYSWHVTADDGTAAVIKVTKQHGAKLRGWYEEDGYEFPMRGTLSPNGRFKLRADAGSAYITATGLFSGDTVSGSYHEYSSDGSLLDKGVFVGRS